MPSHPCSLVTRSIHPRAPALAAAILRCGSHLEPLVAVRPQAAGNPVQVRLGPVPDFRRSAPERISATVCSVLVCRPSHSRIGSSHGSLPAPLLLLLGGEEPRPGGLPPALVGLEAPRPRPRAGRGSRFQFVKTEPCDLDRPEAPVAGLVGQIGVGIGRAGEDGPSRKVHRAAAVGCPVVIDVAREERLHGRACRASALRPRRARRSICRADPGHCPRTEIGDLVSKPVVPGEDPAGRLSASLGTSRTMT